MPSRDAMMTQEATMVDDTTAQDANAPAWLRSIAYSGSHPRPDINAAHSLFFRGTAHTVATNGHQLIAVAHDYGCEPFAATFEPNILGILADDSGDKVPLDLVAFRAFLAGIVTPPTTCEVCGGEGELTCTECDGAGGEECECDCGDVHDRECRRCKNRGVLDCPTCGGKSDAIIRMRLNGKTFNARMLADPPEILRGDMATLTLREQTKPTTIDGDGWRFVVMALRDESTDSIAGEFCTSSTVSLPSP